MSSIPWPIVITGVYTYGTIAVPTIQQLQGQWIDRFISKKIKEGSLKTFVDEKARQIGITRPVVLFTIPEVHDFSVHGSWLSQRVGIALPDPLYTSELESRFFLLHGLHWIKNDSELKKQSIPFISMVALTIILNPASPVSWLSGIAAFFGTATTMSWYLQRKADFAAYKCCTPEEGRAIIAKMKQLAADPRCKAQFGNYKTRAELLEAQSNGIEGGFSLKKTVESVWKATTRFFTQCRERLSIL